MRYHCGVLRPLTKIERVQCKVFGWTPKYVTVTEFVFFIPELDMGELHVPVGFLTDGATSAPGT